MSAEQELPALQSAVDRFLTARKVEGEEFKAYCALIVLANGWNRNSYCACGDKKVNGRCVNEHCLRYKSVDDICGECGQTRNHHNHERLQFADGFPRWGAHVFVKREVPA